MNNIHIGINISNNTIHIGPWSDRWTESNKIDCIKNISHNFILYGVEYPTDFVNYIDMLTLDPCVSYDGVFHIDSPNPQLTIRLFISKLFKHIGVTYTHIAFYYYSILISNIDSIDDIIHNLTYTKSSYCSIM